MLSDDDSQSSEGSDIHQITVNEHFAKAYKAKKEHEELQLLKDKYGSDAELDDEDDSEEDESEDEDGEELTPAMDVAMLRTLSKIRNKDPAIYDPKKNVFEEEQQTTESMKIKQRKKDKSKPLTIKQHALNAVLEAPGSRSPSPSAPVTYAKEQELLKRETVRAFKDAVPSDESDSEEDMLLVPRDKTRDEIEIEEEEYREFLQRELGKEVDLRDLITVEDGVEIIHNEDEEGDTSKKKKEKKKRKDKSKEKRPEETDQDFLVNYILNRGWIDKSTLRVPTYKEVTESKAVNGNDAPSKKSKSKKEEKAPLEGGLGDEPELSDFVEQEDEFDDLADRFESSYNFRFEEPGAATIATHPRNLPSLVRRQDTSRKEAREKKKERKEEEKAKKREEVNRLKALKMREIREKVDMIQKEGGKGVSGDALKSLEDDLDEEWDPLKHDRRMRELYDEEQFYGVQDDDKPEWADDIDIEDIVGPDDGEASDDEGASKKKKRKKKKETAEESNFEAVDEDYMDADVEHDWEFEKAQWDGTEESRKRLMDKYMDEVYGLEFNDMVGDLPTRFRYTTVAPSSYALDPAEILMATDRELNEYISIKRLAPYKNKNKGTWDNERNAKLKDLKSSIASRTWDGIPVGQLVEGRHGDRRNGSGDVKKKRMGKKERKKLKAAAGAEGGENGIEEEHVELNYGEETERPKKRRKKEKAES